MDRIMRAVVPRPMQLAIRNAPPESSMRPAMFFRPMDGLPFFSDSETALSVRKPPPLSVMRMMQLSPSHCVTMRMRPPSPRERMPCTIEFSTSGCKVNFGIMQLSQRASQSISNEIRSPKRSSWSEI